MIHLSTLSSRQGLFVDVKDTRGCLERLTSFFVSQIKDRLSREQRLTNPLLNRTFPLPQKRGQEIVYEKQEWQDSKMLVVLIHGLKSSPLSFTPYFERLSKMKVTCFSPHVYKKGACKLNERAKPILNVVQEYADQLPGNTIVLVGHSNGARIAASIERQVRAKSVRLVSIAGPHGGSLFVNLIDCLKIAPYFGFSPDLVREYTYLGNDAIEELTRWKNAPKKNVERVFFASFDDWMIFPNQTSFPNLPNSTYHTVTGETHMTIIEGVSEKVLDHIANFAAKSAL